MPGASPTMVAVTVAAAAKALLLSLASYWMRIWRLASFAPSDTPKLAPVTVPVVLKPLRTLKV